MTGIAIIGPGAIGSVCAAHLFHTGIDIQLCARSPVNEIVVNTPSGTLKASPPVRLQAGQASPVDWVLLTTKAHQTQSTAHWFQTLCNDHTRIAILQNGVEHAERVQSLAPNHPLLPVVIECPSSRKDDGSVQQRKAGILIVEDSDLGLDFQALFEGTDLTVELTTDFTTAAWRKLCLNVAGAIPAFLLKPTGVVHQADIAATMHGLIVECIQVAQAEGAQLSLSLADQIIDDLKAVPKDSGNSMLSDRLAGKTLEVDARNGAVVRIAEKHGLAAPLNQWVTQELSKQT